MMKNAFLILLALPYIAKGWSLQVPSSRLERITSQVPPVSSYPIGSPRYHGSSTLQLYSSRQKDQSSSDPLTKLSAATDFAEEQAAAVVSSNAVNGGVLTSEDMANLMVDQDAEYQRGLIVISVVTFIFAAHSPLAHAAFSLTSTPPPVLLVNAGAAISALASVLVLKPILENTSMLDTPDLQDELALEQRDDSNDLRAGFEMGLFKTMGATLNFYGLSLTSATHGAFLVQLTTLFVPVIQGIMGVPITKRMWTAVALALSGVLLFTQSGDGSGDATLLGDGLCVASALFLGGYDLSLNKWGDKVPPVTLIQNKIASQALLSTTLLFVFGGPEIFDYIQNVLLSGDINNNLLGFVAIALGNGLLVNAGASLLQVRAQNAIGATTAQVVYATQPLIAALLSYIFLNETVGPLGAVGGGMFLGALFLAGRPEKSEEETSIEKL